MVLTLTLTEFNRSRSKALAAAREGQEVVIRPPAGADTGAVVMHLVDKPLTAVARGIAEGWITPPSRPDGHPPTIRPATTLNPERARAALAEFEDRL